MICKKCGAYNPDHATFCKVCAANLKDQADIDEASQVEEAEEVVEEKVRPRRGNVKAPDFSAVRRDASFKAAPKAKKPVEEEDEDEEEQEEEEEEVRPARKSRFTPPPAPVKKRRIVDEEDEDEEEEDDEDEYDEEEDEAEKLESEPKTTRFSRASRKKRPVVEEDDEEDEDEEDDEEDDEDDGYDDDRYEDDDDDYEEYEPTPPRRKKTSRKQSKSGNGSNIVTLLLICLLAILLIIVGIVAFCNIKGGSTRSKLPGFLQFNCSGKAATEKTAPTQQTNVPPADPQTSNPTDAPVTGTPVDYLATTMEEFTDTDGTACINVVITTRPGDTVTIVLPNQDDSIIKNEFDSDRAFKVKINKDCYLPMAPQEESVYTVTPEIFVTHADGTQENLHVDSFEMHFPTVQLEILDPAQATIPEEGIMAAEGNELVIKGKVDNQVVHVTVNGQRVAYISPEGNFSHTYTMTGEEPETVTIEATQDNCVSSSFSFTLQPYVFIPEKMTLNVVSDPTKLKADKNDKVTVTGTTVPGATLTGTPAAEYQTSVVCGSPVVDTEGNFSFEVTFSKEFYGAATINIHAKKDGYEEGESACTVARMPFADRKKAMTAFNKTKSYHEVPTYSFDKVMENPTAAGMYRFQGSVTSIDAETGVITFAAKTNSKNQKETTDIFVVNLGSWKPKVGSPVKIYCTLNGVNADGSLCVVAWFYV